MKEYIVETRRYDRNLGKTIETHKEFSGTWVEAVREVVSKTIELNTPINSDHVGVFLKSNPGRFLFCFTFINGEWF